MLLLPLIFPNVAELKARFDFGLMILISHSTSDAHQLDEIQEKEANLKGCANVRKESIIIDEDKSIEEICVIIGCAMCGSVYVVGAGSSQLT